METIFKVGDKVFDIQYGWGEITHIHISEWSVLASDFVYCEVKFDTGEVHRYTKIGASKSLSFTEYAFDNRISQKRLIDYNDYLGKWGKFWDYDFKKSCIIGKLCRYHSEDSKPFKVISLHFEYFEPLSEEQIKTLNLE